MKNWGNCVLRATLSGSRVVLTLTPISRHFPPHWLPHSRFSVSVPGSVTSPSVFKVESPPGLGGVNLLWPRRETGCFFLFCVPRLAFSDGRDFLVPSLVIIFLKSSPSFACPSIYPWAHALLGKWKALNTTGACPSRTTRMLPVAFVLVASAEADFLAHLHFCNLNELPNKLRGADTVTPVSFLSELKKHRA